MRIFICLSACVLIGLLLLNNYHSAPVNDLGRESVALYRESGFPLAQKRIAENKANAAYASRSRSAPLSTQQQGRVRALVEYAMRDSPRGNVVNVVDFDPVSNEFGLEEQTSQNDHVFRTWKYGRLTSEQWTMPSGDFLYKEFTETGLLAAVQWHPFVGRSLSLWFDSSGKIETVLEGGE